jgi:hypothetical protein
MGRGTPLLHRLATELSFFVGLSTSDVQGSTEVSPQTCAWMPPFGEVPFEFEETAPSDCGSSG